MNRMMNQRRALTVLANVIDAGAKPARNIARFRRIFDMRSIVFALATLFATAGMTLVAAPLAQAAGEGTLKVAYVDMARALNGVNEGKAAKAKLKKDFGGKQKKLNKMQDALKAKKDQFDARRKMMKPDAIMAKQEELQREFVELQQTFMTLQQELAQKEAKITQDIATKIHKVVGKIGDREAYAMILNIGENVIYYKRHQDITDQVVREYNTTYSKKN